MAGKGSKRRKFEKSGDEAFRTNKFWENNSKQTQAATKANKQNKNE